MNYLTSNDWIHKILWKWWQKHVFCKSLRNGVLYMITWMARVACFHEWHRWCACVDGMLAWVAWGDSCVASMLVWGMWVACFRGWHASMGIVGGVGGVPPWFARYYCCYFYYWNTTMKKKIVKVCVRFFFYQIFIFHKMIVL